MTGIMGLPTPGTHLAGGRIVLGSKYAEGGMSVVHVAIEKATERVLAVKLLIERYKGRPDREQRLLDEGRYLEQIGPSPHIVELVEHGRLEECDGWPFVATELMTGCSLSHLILQERELPLTRICDIAHQLAQAIQFVHERGIVHRDVTAANVFVCRDPDDEHSPDQIKLFDFSHAGRLDGPRGPRGTAGRLTGTFDVPGTHGYMSPEQARGEPVTTAMDVFAFGAVLYELVTRSPLIDIRNRDQYIDLAKREALEVPKLQAWAYEIPEALAELTNACTDLRPEARPSMNHVVQQLAAIRASLAMPDAEPTERVPLERLPIHARGRADAQEGAVELAFARPAHLRPPVSAVVVAPQPQPIAEPTATPDELEPERPAVGRWPLAGAVLLFVLGLGGWAWLAHENESPPKEDPDAARASAEPSEEVSAEAPDASDGGPALEPVPEVEPTEPEPSEKTPSKKGPDEKEPREKGPNKKKVEHPELAVETPKHATPECQAIRTEVSEAMSARKWSTVLEHTNRSGSCWAKSGELRRLRVEALAQTKAWAECIEAGGSSDDPAVVKWVEFCRGRAER